MNCMTQFVAGALATLAFTTAHAGGLYGEIGYSDLDLKVSGSRTSSERMVRGTVGYELHPQLSVEAMLGQGTGGGAPKVNQMMGVFVKPKILGLGNDFELTGRLGYASTKVTKADGTTDRAGSFAYGIGASYRVHPNVTLTLDHMRYRKKDGVTVQGLTAGVGISF